MKKQRDNSSPKLRAAGNRGERIASAVQKHVAEILRDNYADDPVLSGVSLVGALSHGGLQFARLYYYVRDIIPAAGTGGEGAADVVTQNRDAAQRRLDAVKSQIRQELAQRMNQRYVPDLQFMYDDTLERAARVEELLAKAEL